MKSFSIRLLVAVSIFLLCTSNLSAESLDGAIGSSTRWSVGWIDLTKISDFKKGDRLKITVGGTAKKVLIRFLPRGADPNDPVEIDGGPRQVPSDRVLEAILETDHYKIIQISVHGGPNPWGYFPLGQDNGAATIINVERLSISPNKKN
ncbi:MAG TPA: hypothetical protein ACFYD0_15125 [Candidatus Wunengus sp. YC65]|uniref:hypothetical protein n=1 Tax=Candidatus Wunengus sp. YC65 TaxID=3367701 RepID=UPI004025BC42